MASAALHSALLWTLFSLAACSLTTCPGEGRFAPAHACNSTDSGDFFVCAQLISSPTDSSLKSWGTKDYFTWVGQTDPSAAVSMMQSAGGDHACISLWTFATVVGLTGCANVHFSCPATDTTVVLSNYANPESSITESATSLDAATKCIRTTCGITTTTLVPATTAALATIAPVVTTATTAAPVSTSVTGVAIPVPGLPQPEGIVSNNILGTATTSKPADMGITFSTVASTTINAASMSSSFSTTPATISGLPGKWFSGPVGKSCYEVCHMVGSGWTFDPISSKHSGTAAGKHFHPGHIDGAAWKSVECSSADNNKNWAADGSAPDQHWKNPLCSLSCACKQTDQGLSLSASSAAIAPTAKKAAPKTTLSVALLPGATALPVASTSGFSIGSKVIIEPGTANQEVATISAFGSIILAQPLQKAHPAGATIEQEQANQLVTSAPVVFTSPVTSAPTTLPSISGAVQTPVNANGPTASYKTAATPVAVAGFTTLPPAPKGSMTSSSSASISLIGEIILWAAIILTCLGCCGGCFLVLAPPHHKHVQKFNQMAERYPTLRGHVDNLRYQAAKRGVGGKGFGGQFGQEMNQYGGQYGDAAGAYGYGPPGAYNQPGFAQPGYGQGSFPGQQPGYGQPTGSFPAQSGSFHGAQAGSFDHRQGSAYGPSPPRNASWDYKQNAHGYGQQPGHGQQPGYGAGRGGSGGHDYANNYAAYRNQ